MEAIAEIAQKTLSRLIGNRCDNCGIGLRHIDKEGERLWCERCSGAYYRKEKLTEQKAERIIVGLVEPLYYEATIETLEPGIQGKLSDLKTGQDLFLFGPAGVGKTHTMAALIRKYIYEGFQCKRINFDSFCLKVRSTFAPAAKETAWELTEELKSIDKLFIDDLGLRSNSESQFVYDTFYDILNKRKERIINAFGDSPTKMPSKGKRQKKLKQIKES
jgi:DNA replication protein DnaC